MFDIDEMRGCLGCAGRFVNQPAGQTLAAEAKLRDVSEGGHPTALPLQQGGGGGHDRGTIQAGAQLRADLADAAQPRQSRSIQHIDEGFRVVAVAAIADGLRVTRMPVRPNLK